MQQQGSNVCEREGCVWCMYMWMCIYTTLNTVSLSFTGSGFSSVQLLSHVRIFVTPWIAARQASLSITNSRSLLKPMSIELVMPSHPLSFPSPAFNLSQHQGLFKWVSSSHQVAKILEFQPQHQSYEHPGLISLGWTGWISLQSKGLSRVFSSTKIRKHPFSGTQPSLWSTSHRWNS